MYVLGIWDGHDSGAALVRDGAIVYAANEERFTKRKLEVGFPFHSIHAALRFAGAKPHEIGHVAFATAEFTKTLERLFPRMKENYYMFRRRKIPRPSFENARHKLKYSMTTVGVLPFCRGASSMVVRGNLKRLGIRDFKMHVVDHHTAHAASAAFTSGMSRSLVVTLDGLGDGLSGSASILSNGRLERVLAIRARDSLGIFYEQVTNILGMRELEDEGKIMAMADYSYPFPFSDNKFKDFFHISGTQLSARHSPARQYDLVQKIAWQMPREQVAYMAQQLVEGMAFKLVSNLIDRYNIGSLSSAGGLFSNIKSNMIIRQLDNVKSMYVFPHMGDGGLALGAALYADYEITGRTDHAFGAYLGEGYTEEQAEEELRKERALKYERHGVEQSARHAAELVHDGEYVLWFNGRMEYGPRALGDRSIIAPSDSDEVKERLNLTVKRREWFQPFAPSVLESDAENIIEYDGKGYDRFMTTAYPLKRELRDRHKSIMHVDGSARAQIVGKENPAYSMLLSEMKKIGGRGMVLNTSFNIHGMPIVMSPRDAIEMMRATKTKHMFINGIFVTNRAVA
jgi:carbamoyltransferase